MRISHSAVLFPLAIPAFAGPLKQAFPVPEPARAAAVKEAFQLSWDAYYQHAFPHDSLRPISNTSVDDRCVVSDEFRLCVWPLTNARRNGWGVTAIDALTTAIIMEGADTVMQILEFIPTIDFSTTKGVNSRISVFESTIRYLGGLVSGINPAFVPESFSLTKTPSLRPPQRPIQAPRAGPSPRRIPPLAGS